jgi:tetratricopeptide (TPR) repeat protein
LETLREAARLFPRSPGPAFGLASAHLFAGEPDKARIELEHVRQGKYAATDPDAALSARGLLDWYSGRFRTAVAALDQAAAGARRAGDVPAMGEFTRLKAWMLVSGSRNFATARKVAGDLFKMGRDPFVFYILMGDVELAAAMVESRSSTWLESDLLLAALRERKRGASAEAVARYEQLAEAPYEKHWRLYELARLYLDRSEPQKAAAALRKLQSLYPAAAEFGWFLFYYPRSFYLLGQAYERGGDAAAALQAYQRFLTLWKDADPDLEELQDAKTRVAALQGR